MMPTTSLLGIALALALAGLGVQTVRVAHRDAELAQERQSRAEERAAAVEAARETERLNQRRADHAAQDFEAWKAAQRPKVITIKQEVRNAQADSVCRDQPLPGSLRDTLSRAPGAVGARDAGEPGGVSGLGPR